MILEKDYEMIVRIKTNDFYINPQFLEHFYVLTFVMKGKGGIDRIFSYFSQEFCKRTQSIEKFFDSFKYFVDNKC